MHPADCGQAPRAMCIIILVPDPGWVGLPALLLSWPLPEAAAAGMRCRYRSCCDTASSSCSSPPGFCPAEGWFSHPANFVQWTHTEADPPCLLQVFRQRILPPHYDHLLLVYRPFWSSLSGLTDHEHLGKRKERKAVSAPVSYTITPVSNAPWTQRDHCLPYFSVIVKNVTFSIIQSWIYSVYRPGQI